MAEEREAPVHYDSREAFAWQAGYEAGTAEGRRLALEDATDRIDIELGPGVVSRERAIVRQMLEEADRG